MNLEEKARTILDDVIYLLEENFIDKRNRLVRRLINLISQATREEDLGEFEKKTKISSPGQCYILLDDIREYYRTKIGGVNERG